MPDALVKPLAVVVLLGVLIFVHELGHFLVAKLLRVKVLRFSIGFGPPLLSFRRGETEYWLAWLPLGGYVKMAGQEPGAEVAEEDRGRGFLEQAPWKRLAISLAGPVMNFILPFVLITALYGSTVGTDVPGAIVGTVFPGSPAEQAGLQPADRILAVTGPDGQRRITRDFSELVEQVSPHPGEPLVLEVERAGEPIAPITLRPEGDLRSNGVENETRGVIGISATYAPARVAPVAPGAAGPVEPFDLVLAVDGRPVARAIDLAPLLADGACKPVDLEVLRERPAGPPGAVLADYARERLSGVPTCHDGKPSLRLVDPTLAAAVAAVVPGGPADRAGVRRGDVVTAVNARKVHSAFELERAVRAELGDAKPGTLTLADGRVVPITADLEPVEGAIRKDDRFRPSLGIRASRRALLGDDLDVATVKFQRSLPEIVRFGAVTTVEQARLLVVVIAKLFTREVDSRIIGGPIQIVQETAKAVDQGWMAFVWLMAAISVNLGVANLLPVPVLDGGHIVQALLETVTRRRLSTRAREVAAVVGLVLLVLLFLYAAKNDILR